MRKKRAALLQEAMAEAQVQQWSVSEIIDRVQHLSVRRLGYNWRPTPEDIQAEE
ncbi:MAG: hypothetical protein ACTSYL_01715 [Candidatus Thorarchaeota archaeon]